MLTVKDYLVSEDKNEVYKALKEMLPEDDYYMHYRLDGNVLDCC